MYSITNLKEMWVGVPVSNYDPDSNCNHHSGGSRISRRGGVDLIGGGRGLLRRLRFVKFVCQNERIGSLGGARRVRPPKSANASHISLLIHLFISILRVYPCKVITEVKYSFYCTLYHTLWIGHCLRLVYWCVYVCACVCWYGVQHRILQNPTI